MGRGPDGGPGASSRRRPSADPRPPRPAPASCPPPPQQRPGDPDARAFGGGSWRSSLLPRRQGALGFGASALPGGRTAGPCAAPPRTPKENETAARWRRPRQGRGREGRAEPHVRRPVLGVPATEDTGVGGETFLPPTPTTQNHKEKPSLHRRESWHPRVQQGAGTTPGHPPPMWAHLLSPSRCEWRLAALRGRLAWRDCGWTPGSPHSGDQATVPGTDTFRASPPAPSPR